MTISTTNSTVSTIHYPPKHKPHANTRIGSTIQLGAVRSAKYPGAPVLGVSFSPNLPAIPRHRLNFQLQRWTRPSPGCYGPLRVVDR